MIAVATNGETAEVVAKHFFEDVVCQQSAPHELLTDQGPAFTSRLMIQICNAAWTKKYFTTAYHPQANGQVERANETFLACIRAYCERCDAEWDLVLKFICFAVNVSVTGESAFYLLHLRDPDASRGAGECIGQDPGAAEQPECSLIASSRTSSSSPTRFSL